MSDSERRKPVGTDEVAVEGTSDVENPAVERVGLVLSGAAARGPYQAGALAELIPALIAERKSPVIILGTSSGALNAALLAQFADHGEDAGERVVRTWLEIGSPFINAWLSLPLKATQLVARAVGVPAIVPVMGLLDPRPLTQFANQRFDQDQLAANIRDGLVESVGAAATYCPQGQAAARTRLFVQGRVSDQLLQDHVVDVVPTQLRVEHLLASAAIPALFPPVAITEPARYRGDYIDGGVRLNAPLHAALSLGVTRLVVVSGHSVRSHYQPPTTDTGRGPDLATSLAISLRAVLADGLTDDLHALRRRNRCAQNDADRVPYRFVAPEDGELAALAAECFRPHRWRPFDSYALIGRLLAAAGDGIGRNELLSLVFFDRPYFEKQIELGRKHARAALGQPWQF